MDLHVEGRIALAIQALRSKRITSVRTSAKLYDVPETTLRRRLNGTESRRSTRPIMSKLTQTEEEVLLQRIFDLDEQGFPL